MASALRHIFRLSGRLARNSRQAFLQARQISCARSVSAVTTNSKFCQDISNSETVYALSSGSGKCGVAVIRLSGPSTKQALLKLLGNQRFVVARTASLRQLLHPESGDILDQALVLWFPGPNSFTGEDAAELHVHGSFAVVAAVYSALSGIPGLRMAEPGEFTKRAFHHNKLDLTAVEGLADLIHAETEAQRQQALRQMQGELGVLYNNWSQRLLKILADVEAVIDFGEDEEIADSILEQVPSRLEKLSKEIGNHLSDKRCGERLRSGVHVAIVGAPNVGKSSLLNFLCQRQAAIVSPIAGTTRDVLDLTVNLSGYPIVLSDTAGLRETVDPIEKEGVRRATQRVDTADLTMAVLDVSCEWQSLLPLYTSLLKGKQNGGESVLVMNKIDLVSDHESVIKNVKNHFPEVPCCAISCKMENGMETFLDKITDIVKILCGNPLAGNPSLTQARHRQHLQNCQKHLLSYYEQVDVVLAAEELRLALNHLGEITGKVRAEDILDVIFRDFCIGK